MSNDRYQFQPWYIKTYRWLRWRPVFALKFLWWLILWGSDGFTQPPGYGDVFRGRQKWSRYWHLKHYWTMSISMAQQKMKHYHTTEEIIYALRTKEDSRAARQDG